MNKQAIEMLSKNVKTMQDTIVSLTDYIEMLCLMTNCGNNTGKDICGDCPLDKMSDIILDYWSNEIDKKELLKKGKNNENRTGNYLS